MFITLNKYHSEDNWKIVKQSSFRHLLFISNFGEPELETPGNHWTR